MTSRKRRQSRPIESVKLKILFKTDKLTAGRIKASLPSAVLRAAGCEVTIDGERPGEVAEKARAMLDKLKIAVEDGRKSESPAKDFKELEPVGTGS